MPLFTTEERRFAEGIADLMYVRLVVQRSQQTLDAARRRQIAGTTFGEQDARR